MKKLSLVLCLATICLASSLAFAAFQTPDIRLDTGDPLGASDSNSLQICSSSDGHVYAAWFDYRNDPTGEIFFNSSADFGQTWSNPVSVATFNENRGFNLDCINNGYVHIVYAYCSISYCWVMHLESADNGTLWNLFGPLNPGVMYNEINFDPTPRICSAENGSIHLVWEDNGRYGWGDGTSDIYYAGAGGGKRINTWDSDASSPTISCTENGHAYVVWEDNVADSGMGYRDLVFNQSSDNGWSWQPSAVKIDEGWGNSIAFWPMMCNTESGNVYIAWSDNRDGSYNPYFNRSTDYGASWQPIDTRLNTGDVAGANNSLPGDIGCTSDGYVYSVYTDRRNIPNADIYFNYSGDSGNTWQNPDIRVDLGDSLGQAISVNVQLTNDDVGNVYASFMDARNGGWDILFSKSSDHGATWFSNPERVNTGSSPGSGSAWYQQILLDPSGRVYVAWQDDRTVPGTRDIYINYWTATFGMTPTLSETMVVLLGAALAFALFFAVSRKSKALRRPN